MKISAIALLSVGLFTCSTANAAVFDLNGITNASTDGANGVVTTLDAGLYTVSFTASTYGAFSRFPGIVSGCNGVGMQCTAGYENSLGIVAGFAHFLLGDRDADGGKRTPASTGYYSNGAVALAEASKTTYTFGLEASSTVRFFIPDAYAGDNVGGVSFSLSPQASAVPEPASWTLMIGGFGLVGGIARRRRTQTLSLGTAFA